MTSDEELRRAWRAFERLVILAENQRDWEGRRWARIAMDSVDYIREGDRVQRKLEEVFLRRWGVEYQYGDMWTRRYSTPPPPPLTGFMSDVNIIN
jgi:hypothetical protein